MVHEATNWVASNYQGLTVVALPASAALAAVALIGYIFGRRTHRPVDISPDMRRQKELERAAGIAWQLESIADRLRQDLVAHHAQVEAFKQRLSRAQSDGSEETWKQLCVEAESVLGPTMQLAQQLSHAYDEFRQQSDALETFSGGRTDPLTGAGNSRALEGQLQVLLNATNGAAGDFVVAIVSLDRMAVDIGDRANSVSQLPKMAGMIRACMRDSDFVARFGEEEFAVVMPQTTLAGACVFGDRLRERVATEMNLSVCCGVAAAIAGDDEKSLLTRADSALYSARATGMNRLFVHNGTQIREHQASAAASKMPDVRKASVQTIDQRKPPMDEPSPVEELVVSGSQDG